MKRLTAALGAALFTLLAIGSGPAVACGGFFCSNVPVDQTGERIIFTVNDDQTITTLVQIQYFGEADDFSWILPIPEAIGVDDLQVPEDGEDAFTRLHSLTDVVITPPPRPECSTRMIDAMMVSDDAMEESAAYSTGVEIFGSGEVGPFGFDIIGSSDPDALINWLRDNNYRVEESMEPLIDVYVEMEMAFVAMRLLDGQDSSAIEPIELTYPGTDPMIPLQLTAVAANPNMPIYVWIFADEQAVPVNFAHMEVATEEITFNSFGGNDYSRLVAMRADANDGRAFITEYAQPTEVSQFAGNSYLEARAEEQPYLTRLFTAIDPEEMTADPVFTTESGLENVSNVRDASNMTGLYDCERDGRIGFIPQVSESDALEPFVDATTVSPTPSVTPVVNVERNRWTVSLATLAIGAVMMAGAVVVSQNQLKNRD